MKNNPRITLSVAALVTLALLPLLVTGWLIHRICDPITGWIESSVKRCQRQLNQQNPESTES